MGERRPWASCVWLELIEVNRSGSVVESCRMAYSVDIVRESLHYSIRAGPGTMKFGRSSWRRVGGTTILCELNRAFHPVLSPSCVTENARSGEGL